MAISYNDASLLLKATMSENADTSTPRAHPMYFIPWFRRWPSSPLRDIAYTALWNLLMALFFTALNMLLAKPGASLVAHFWASFVISNAIGFLIHFGLVAVEWASNGWPSRSTGWRRSLYYMSMLTACILIGMSLGNAVLRGVHPLVYLQGGAVAQFLPFALFLSLFVFGVLLTLERRMRAEALAARQREQIAEGAAQLAQAQLRALQAQIEPHFLYNTLANVVSMIEPQPQQAKHMLLRLIDFLRSSLAASRAEHATLGSEFDLAAAYLDVLKMRMGARLSYRIQIDDALRDQPIAPMLLQPLIENAVIHGLEPKLEGGEIVLTALLDHELLCVQIQDSGVGIAAGGLVSKKVGGGVGMANLRERLFSLYGPQARVQLSENSSCGITAKLWLPVGVNH